MAYTEQRQAWHTRLAEAMCGEPTENMQASWLKQLKPRTIGWKATHQAAVLNKAWLRRPDGNQREYADQPLDLMLDRR